MKKETKIRTIGLTAILSMAIYFAAYVSDNEFKHKEPAASVHSYETDEHRFYNGEILMPDYVHLDTLSVTDADFLNEMIIEDKYQIQGDGDISDLLGVGAVSVSTEYLVKK